MRLHGDREPHKPQFGTTGGAACLSGADNEVWSYGPEVEKICAKYLFLRERMKPYLTKIMREAHEKGTPVMRALFYEFPEDEACWEDQEEYLFGPDVLVAPVMYAGKTQREVYLPAGASWTDVWTGEKYEGGRRITVPAPLDRIPLFTKNDAALPLRG